MKIKKYSFLIGPAILVYILFRIDFGNLIELLGSVKISFIFIAVSLLPLFFLLMIFRWKKIIESCKINFSFKNALISLLKGTALGVVTPGKLGELYKFRYLQKISKSSMGVSLSTVVIDRLMDVSALIFLGLLSILITVNIYAIKISFRIVLVLSLFFILSAFLFTKKNVMKKILKPFFNLFIPPDHKKNVALHFNEFYRGLRLITAKSYVICAFYTLLVWSVNILAPYFLSKSLGMGVPLWFMALAMPLVSIINLIPISVSGLGTSQLAFIFTLSLIGISSEYAVALSFLFFALGLVRAIPGAILYTFGK